MEKFPVLKYPNCRKMRQQDLNLFKILYLQILLKQMIFGVFGLYFSTPELPKTDLRKIAFQNSIKDLVGFMAVYRT